MPTGTPTETALILLGGEPLPAGSFEWLPDPTILRRHTVVIAADSGIDQAHRLGLTIDIAIGDFDSVTDDGLDQAIRHGADVRRHEAAKDATDFELALDVVLSLGLGGATVVGGEGGRLDHLIANALVMASPRYAALDLSALGRDGSRLHVVRDRRVITGQPGEILSLLAVNGPAEGVRTKGLRFSLDGERLDPGSSLGVSNEMLASKSEVSLTSGVLLAVLPGPRYLPARSTVSQSDQQPPGETP